jgi:hypothetical protein
MNRTLFVAVVLFSLATSARAGGLLEGECKGKTHHGDKIRARLQVFPGDDGGEIVLDGKGYGPLSFKKETHKGYKYKSDDHGGLSFKVDFRGRYVVGESDKLGKFTLVCGSPRLPADDESDHDLDLAEIYFERDFDN